MFSMFNELRVKRLTTTAKLPTRANPTDSGLDLYADIKEPITINPGCRLLIPTGISIELPQHQVVINGMEFVYEAQIRPRSGLAIKRGLTILNSPGTIDASYRGEIKVIAYNSNPVILIDGGGWAHEYDIIIQPQDRIAQLVIGLVALPTIVEVEELTETERGVGGFGSTGTK